LNFVSFQYSFCDHSYNMWMHRTQVWHFYYAFQNIIEMSSCVEWRAKLMRAWRKCKAAERNEAFWFNSFA